MACGSLLFMPVPPFAFNLFKGYIPQRVYQVVKGINWLVYGFAALIAFPFVPA
jgi:hypothetical protein